MDVHLHHTHHYNQSALSCYSITAAFNDYYSDRIWDVFTVDYLDSNTLQLAYKAFIRPMMEYGNVAIIGASATQLSWIDTVHNAATALCHASLIPLQRHHHAAACSWITVETV